MLLQTHHRHLGWNGNWTVTRVWPPCGDASPEAFIDLTGPSSDLELARELQAMLGFTAFNDIWYVSQFLFGLHLLLIGYLAYRSGYVPRLLGALIAISGLGYAADSLGAVLSQGSWTDISAFTFIGEFLLALWLLIRARSIAVSTSALDEERLPVAR